MQWHKLPVLKISDILVPALGLGSFLTRIGCFFNGCCYGTPTNVPWGVIFPPESAAGYHFTNIPIHPAQLYSSFYGLLILVILLIIERWKRYDGFLLYVFLILYGLSRFTVDLFRYYEESMVLIYIGNQPLSVNQGISFLMMIAGLSLIIYNYTKIKKNNS
jgi:phosphatidylglycerol:prolipoprotein diacylglycerol transferase